MRSEAEKQAQLLLLRLKELDDWQATTELKIREKQRRELASVFPPGTGDMGDTEDDTVSSMEYDDTLDREEQPRVTRENGGENKIAVGQSIGDNITFLKRNPNFQKHDQKADSKVQEDHDQSDEQMVSGSNYGQRKKEPRPFLKRGSGLARFKLSTDLSQLPCRVRRRQPDVSRVQSRYTEDTQAFANRKAEIRSSRDNLHHQQQGNESRPASAAPKMFRPRSSKNVSSNKLSPVLKQIMNKKIQSEQDQNGNTKLFQREHAACDSVEHSFKEKLSVQSQRNDKDEKELEVFEMLEGATLHSSFSSTNSAINSLWKKSILNSPSKLTITTGDKGEKENQYKASDYLDSTDPSLGETLVNDIESFLQKANPVIRNEPNDDDSSETISETSTIKDEEEMSERGSDDDVVHVECYVKPEQKEPKPAIKSNGGGGEILEAAVQEHQMSSLQENHQLTVLKLRVIELESEVEKYKENYDQENGKSLMKPMNGIKGSNAVKIHSKKPTDCLNCKRLREEKNELQSKLKEKEDNLKKALAKISENVSKSRKDKLALENKNHRMRIKYAESRVGQMLRNNCSKSTPNLTKILLESSEPVSPEKTASIQSPLKTCASAHEIKTTMEFSSADSLESSMSLVSAGITTASTLTRSSPSSSEVTEVIVNAEKGTREKRFKDGKVETWYSNGNRKEVSSDGSVVTVFYYNGDMKESHRSGLVRYLYSDTGTWLTTHPDGREVTHFSNGQTEERHIDGGVSIVFPDGTTKTISPSGTENITFPDSTVVIVKANGSRTVKMPQVNHQSAKLQARQRYLIK